MLRNWFSFLLCLCLLFVSGCVSDNLNKTERPDKEVAETYLQMGVGYMELGKYNVAMERLQYALKLDDDNASTHDALAVLYQKLNDDKEAVAHFKKSLKLDPDNPSAKNNYGRYLCDKGQYQEGMNYLKESLNMPTNSRRWYALTNIGICEYNHGKRVQAEQYLREALQLFPEYAPALQQMIVVSFDKKNYVSAKAFLERYLGVKKHSSTTLYYAMLIEQANGNKEQAVRIKAILIEKYPLSKEAASLM